MFPFGKPPPSARDALRKRAGVQCRLHDLTRTHIRKAAKRSVVNTPQWGNPNTDITSSNFGKITGAGGARSIQLGAKLTF